MLPEGGEEADPQEAPKTSDEQKLEPCTGEQNTSEEQKDEPDKEQQGGKASKAEPTPTEETDRTRPDREQWRLDKFGTTLNPQALHMRFYRGLRSKRDPPPPEVQKQIMEAEKDKGNAKLHTLYQHYLACKGEWKDSVLCISVSQKHRAKQNELFTFVTYKDLDSKYGADLAKDLKERLEEQEKKVEKKTPGKYVRKHPDFPERQEMWLYRSFLSMNEIKEREKEHSATITLEGSVDAEDAMDALPLGWQVVVVLVVVVVVW